MDWLLLSMVAYLMYAINNVNVRGIISNYVENGRNYLVLFGVIWVFFLSSIILLFGLPVPSPRMFFILAVNGVLTAFSLYFLYVAVSKDDVYKAAVLLSISPVFTAIFSHLFLGETFHGQKLLGVVMLVLAGVLASVSKDSLGNWRVSPAVGYALLASILMAFSNVVFKFATNSISPVAALTWGRIFVIVVVVGVMLKKTWRQNFRQMVSKLSVKSFGLVILNESIALIGTFAFIFAIARSTATLVSAMSAVYPLFTFILGAVYTILIPKFLTEDLRLHAVALKVASIAFLIPGILLLSQVPL